MTEILELVNQEFKGVIIKMLQGAIMDTFETNRKSQKINEIDKKKQTEILELKNTKAKITVSVRTLPQDFCSNGQNINELISLVAVITFK